MKQTSTKIIKRALELADLQNTSFLSHQELTAYLNESWRGLYQMFINQSDKQFVCETSLKLAGGGITEYCIPCDLFQIHSLKDRISGRVYLRAPVNASPVSGTYEIFNNKIRLYGIGGDLVLTYYKTPTYISIPNKTIKLDIEGNILSTSGNNILLESGSIYDVINQEKIGEVTINEQVEQVVLCKGFVVFKINVDGEYYVLYTSYKDNQLFVKNIDGDFTLLNDGYYWYDNQVWFKDEDIFDSDTSDIYVTKNKDIILRRDIKEIPMFNDQETFLSTSEPVMYEGNDLTATKLDIDYFDLLGVVDYGYITTDGTDKYLVSYIPDTLLNFPNQLYFELIAAECAMRFLLKQNADITGLQNIYNNMANSYKNSLSQNGAYPRITNIYGD